MKTSKEMQLKILERVIRNIQEDRCIREGIEVYHEFWYSWGGEILSPANSLYFEFDDFEYRVKPETIKINGVEIPKPLEYEDIASYPEKVYYVVSCCGSNHIMTSGDLCIERGYHFVYNTKQEAITASRKLFGMTEK